MHNNLCHNLKTYAVDKYHFQHYGRCVLTKKQIHLNLYHKNEVILILQYITAQMLTASLAVHHSSIITK